MTRTELVVPGFVLEKTGMVPEGKPTFDQWKIALSTLERIDGAVHWWIGDLLNYGEITYRETYDDAVEKTGFERKTLWDDKWVSERIENSRRRESLSWSHHKEVASLEPDEQDDLLSQAEENDWSKQDLRNAVRKQGFALEAINHAAELKLRAERKLGEFLKEMPKHNGDPRLHDATRLSDLGIEKTQSHRWQRIASIPEPEFERHIVETVVKKELTTAGMLKLWS